MIALCRRVAEEPEVAAAIAHLSRGDFLGRYLALYTCFTNRERSLVLHALADPSRIIRNLALRLVPIVGTSEDFAHTYEPRDGHFESSAIARHPAHQDYTCIYASPDGRAAVSIR